MKDCTVPLVADLDKTRRNRSIQQRQEDPDEATKSGSASAERFDISSSLDTFLDSWTKLDIIQHKSLTNIYSGRNATGPWQDTQRAIASLMDDLDEWALEALPQKQFYTATTTSVSEQRQRLLLYFYYQSAKMCITRPCLCRLDQRLKGQSEESARFNQHQADACIQAALDLTAQLTPPRDAQWIYENGPWWSNVHISMLLKLLVTDVQLTLYSHAGFDCNAARARTEHKRLVPGPLPTHFERRNPRRVAENHEDGRRGGCKRL